jgi:hypothetical protein
MSQIRTKDTVDAVKELVSQLTPIYIVKEAVDNGDGTFTLSTNRTWWLTINKRITIDSIEYRITAFEINVSITIKPVTTGDPIPTVTFFTIPAPLFFHGVTLMAVDEQGKNKDPNGRLPFVWLYEILDETVIKDEFDPWGRSSKPQLFFMDESSLANWTSADHKTNVLEPMRQMVELFFEKINDFEGDKYKEILTSSQIARANWGKFITDLGSVKKFFNDDLSGHQVGFDFVMSKSECDTRSENVVACGLTAQVTTIAETAVDADDGIAIATPIGGIGPYSYSWSGPNGFSSTLQCVVDLEPGVYTVVITDNGVEQCSDQESGTVSAAGGACALVIDSVTNTPPSTVGGSNGTATVNHSGEVGSVSILWTPSGQTTATATGLVAGSYCVTVVDLGASNCFKAGETTLAESSLNNNVIIDGVNDYIDLGTPSELNLNGNMSVSFWVNMDAVTTSGLGEAVISDVSAAGASGTFAIMTRRLLDGSVVIDCGGFVLTSTAFLSASTWTHVTYTRSGVTGNWDHILYNEAVFDSSTIGSSSNPKSYNGLSIGRGGQFNGQYLGGKIKGLTIWSRTLSPTDITAINTAGANANVSTLGISGLVRGFRMNGTGSETTAIDDSCLKTDGVLNNFTGSIWETYTG